MPTLFVPVQNALNPIKSKLHSTFYIQNIDGMQSTSK